MISAEQAIKFISKLTIKSKSIDGTQRLIKLIPTEEQQIICDYYFNGKSLVILKARQIGLTTILAACIFTDLILSTDPIAIGVMAHTIRLSEKVLGFAALMYNSLPPMIKKVFPAKITKHKILMLNTGACIEARGMDESGGLRGDTYNKVVITEFSLAKDPDDLLAKSLAAVNQGQIIMEGTAQYIGDGLHKQFQLAQGKYSTRVPVFFPWTMHKDYAHQVPSDFQPTEDEQILMDQWSLTPEQVMFRRNTILGRGLSPEAFAQEYPFSFEDAYRQAPGSFINIKLLENILTLSTIENDVCWHALPTPYDNYVIGADPSGGTGRNFASVHVLNARTYQVMATYRSNTIYPWQFADILANLSVRYNQAPVNVETNNNCGGQVQERLRSLDIPLFDSTPWLTTKQSKFPLLDNLRTTIIQGSIKQLDNFTIDDLKNAKMDIEGNIIDNKKSIGSHFDGGMSLALACLAAKNIDLPESYSFWNNNKSNQSIKSDRRIY